MNVTRAQGQQWLTMAIFVAVIVVGLALILFASGVGTGFVYDDV